MLTAQFHKILIVSTLVGFCGFASAQPLTNTQALSGTAATDTLILKAAQASFAEYFDLLALPNDAVVATDIQKNTDWLAQAFTQPGLWFYAGSSLAVVALSALGRRAVPQKA